TPRGPITAPVAKSERIAAIDVLRGFAVLGILMVNVQGFARISSAYSNPASGRVLEAADQWTWAAIYLFFDTKFISIFSLLFGVGIAIMSERMASRGLSGTGLHYRRQLWLLVIGLMHAFLIWHGDVLVAYALCGFLLYPLRNLAPRWQLWIGGVAVSVVVVLLGLILLALPYLPEADRADLMAEWAHPQEEIDAEIAAFRGSWTDQLPERASLYLLGIGSVFPFYVFWRAGGLMLVGMALYRLGVVTGARSAVFYRRMAVLGLATGLPLCVWGASAMVRPGVESDQVMFSTLLLNYVGSIGVFLGYVALVILMVKGGWLSWLRRRLEAAGRMALTNYISQSIICSLIFYGHGLGLFERVSALGQVGVVVAIWALQLAWSPWWLARFRFGPVEWIWRSATYMKQQPMKA
ncbi:MAG: DUF418 domain-containing protein, partial [Gemmatimonadetes bacterium]|nr:DUF418 domain-containing protein [Gemmatimonadota bacterium]